MAINLIRRLTTGIVPLIGMLVLLLVSFYMLSNATENTARFSNLYDWMLLVNLAGLLVLVGLIGVNLYKLVVQYRANEAGSRLTARLVLVFVVLSVLPVTVVYYFSLQFLQRGVDSWFDIRIEKSLEDALQLSQVSLDLRKRELSGQVEAMASELSEVSNINAALAMSDMLNRSDALELTMIGQNNRIIAFSSADPSKVVPHRTSEDVLMQVRQGHRYVGLEPVKDAGLHVRIVVPIPSLRADSETRMRQALFPIDQRLNTLADSVQGYYAAYKKLAYLRSQLKNSFLLTLSLVLLLSLFAAVWVAFFSAQRLVAPVRDLAKGTRAVARGDYDMQLPAASHDELGFLVHSFNDMTRKIARASMDARRSQQQVESQRSYLETVLENLSSGVITLDRKFRIRTVNSVAGYILDIPFQTYLGKPLGEIVEQYPAMSRLIQSIMPLLTGAELEWREEVILFTREGRKVLMCRGTTLVSDRGVRGDHVIVFDDVTTLIQAQRDAAWGEVARRLAHEIKNPLTPIQLSAERLRHKYLNTMSEQDARVLDRSTHTIVQQVEAMKEMVNAFAEYARAPMVELAQVNLNMLIREVVDLYGTSTQDTQIDMELDARTPMVEADGGRLRQLLHNLLKNALEAMESLPSKRIDISTRCMDESGCRFVEITVRDYGKGFPDDMRGQYFEPYVTTKPKGTGLGLAIVKKIVEEHGGMVWAENLADRGARIIIRLPAMGSEFQAGSTAQNVNSKQTG